MPASNDIPALIESVCKPHADVNDMRTLLLAFYAQHNVHNQSNGTNWLSPTSSTQKAAGLPPPAATASAQGANGAYTLNIQNPDLAVNKTIYHEVSYSPVKNFSQDVTTLPHTAQTSIAVPTPGTSSFLRIRSSYDRVHWNQHQLIQNTAVDAGLQSSEASANAMVLNQSNYATVTAEGSVGGAPVIRIAGPGGPYSGYVAIKGTVQSKRPSATIVNGTYQQTAFVAFDGKRFQVGSSLPQTFPDSWEPVAQVVVNGTPGGGGPTGANPGRLIDLSSQNVTAGPGLVGGGASPAVIALATPVPVAFGGTGTPTPALIAGPGIAITGTWPAEMISATGGGAGDYSEIFQLMGA